MSFRIDARTRKNVGVDPQEPPRDETGVDATGVALNEVQLGKLALRAAGKIWCDPSLAGRAAVSCEEPGGTIAAAGYAPGAKVPSHTLAVGVLAQLAPKPRAGRVL